MVPPVTRLEQPEMQEFFLAVHGDDFSAGVWPESRPLNKGYVHTLENPNDGKFWICWCSRPIILNTEKKN